MSVLVFTNAKVNINSASLSDHTRNVSLEYTAELLSATAMGTASTRNRVAGFKDWTLTVEFLNDFADSSVDEKLFAMVGTKVPVKVRPVNTSIAATNPEYVGSAYLETHQPFGGGVGEVAMTSATFRAAGALTRDVTP